ncbi:hypothetical protein N5J48_12410 [Acinetobacter ursingii]|uniref:hypothetical protein n=1 Tax=Acinetobacter ursingii TaxID=108980 RepID=UPI00244C49B4|nr:hypothetical protein [Acinetobacter ursingii]MDH0008372.1 hypothetical protein [Acinetobacter ursingii]MDH0480176.1 hypothetical protein [Acinetobacter ursingii]MDH2120784.1 hypothetical protein [Acinetobacter ursingii]MDH2128354.1 hypothetical protein [Acinetobacter ursingii]
MNAHKFVAVHGIEKAKAVVEGAPEYSLFYDLERNKHVPAESTSIAMAFLKNRFLSVEDLQRLVKSFELVNHVGGIECANQILETTPDSWCFACADLRKKEVVRSAPSHNDFVYIADLEKAIADYEAVHLDEVSTLRGIANGHAG